MNDVTFRIYTEDVNKKKIEEIVSKYFEGYTTYKAKGYWRGQVENSLIIEIVGSSEMLKKTDKVAKEIKKVNEQEAVLVQKIRNDNWLV